MFSTGCFLMSSSSASSNSTQSPSAFNKSQISLKVSYCRCHSWFRVFPLISNKLSFSSWTLMEKRRSLLRKRWNLIWKKKEKWIQNPWPKLWRRRLTPNLVRLGIVLLERALALWFLTKTISLSSSTSTIMLFFCSRVEEWQVMSSERQFNETYKEVQSEFRLSNVFWLIWNKLCHCFWSSLSYKLCFTLYQVFLIVLIVKVAIVNDVDCMRNSLSCFMTRNKYVIVVLRVERFQRKCFA